MGLEAAEATFAVEDAISRGTRAIRGAAGRPAVPGVADRGTSIRESSIRRRSSSPRRRRDQNCRRAAGKNGAPRRADETHSPRVLADTLLTHRTGRWQHSPEVAISTSSHDRKSLAPCAPASPIAKHGAVVPPLPLVVRVLESCKPRQPTRSGNPALASRTRSPSSRGRARRGEARGCRRRSSSICYARATRSSRRIMAERSGCCGRWRETALLTHVRESHRATRIRDRAACASRMDQTPKQSLLRVTDVRRIADAAHAVGGRLSVDNTFFLRRSNNQSRSRRRRCAFDSRVSQQPRRRRRRGGGARHCARRRALVSHVSGSPGRRSTVSDVAASALRSARAASPTRAVVDTPSSADGAAGTTLGWRRIRGTRSPSRQ